jgi:hypothetical protein
MDLMYEQKFTRNSLVFETLKEFALICQMTIILLERGAPGVVHIVF